jgi:hypothetical protein
MRPDPKKRNPAGGPGFGDDLEMMVQRDDTALTRERAWQLLLHAADVLTSAAGVMLSEGRISHAGRELVTYTAIRLRQIREALQ